MPRNDKAKSVKPSPVSASDRATKLTSWSKSSPEALGGSLNNPGALTNSQNSLGLLPGQGTESLFANKAHRVLTHPEANSSWPQLGHPTDKKSPALHESPLTAHSAAEKITTSHNLAYPDTMSRWSTHHDWPELNSSNLSSVAFQDMPNIQLPSSPNNLPDIPGIQAGNYATDAMSSVTGVEGEGELKGLAAQIEKLVSAISETDQSKYGHVAYDQIPEGMDTNTEAWEASPEVLKALSAASSPSLDLLTLIKTGTIGSKK